MRKFEPDELHCVQGEQGLVGKGSFGTVLLAFHDVHNTIALKCMELVGGYNTIKTMEENFKYELENLQRCNHENVVRILGWSQWSNTFAMVMEYLPAGNLMEVVASHSIDIPPLLQLRVCYDIASGISFIHNFSKEKRLVHGDIKPENVLLTMDLRCKISDFGSAKLSLCSEYHTVTSSTSTAEKNNFTQFYAAPELLKSPLKKMHHSMDTYSYGMLVYVVLGKEVPNVDLDLFKESILYGDRPDLDDILDMKRALEEQGKVEEFKAMEALISAMEECWKQEPSDRPAMLEIKDKLYTAVAKVPPYQISQCVSNALKNMEMPVPVRDQCKLTSAKQLGLFPAKRSGNRSATLASYVTSPALTPRTLVNSSSSSDLPSGEATIASTDLLSSIKHLLERNKVTEAVLQTKELISTVSSFDNPDVIVEESIAIAGLLNKKSKFLPSLGLIEWCSDVCGKIVNPDDKFRNLYECCKVVYDICLSTSDPIPKVDVELRCKPLLEKSLECLKRINIEDTTYQFESKTSCLLYIGRCNVSIGRNELAIDIAHSCLTSITSLYGNDAPKHQILSSCNRLLAAGHHNIRNYEIAIEHEKRFLKTIQSAQDVNEEEREKMTKEVKKWLRLSKKANRELNGQCVIL